MCSACPIWTASRLPCHDADRERPPVARRTLRQRLKPFQRPMRLYLVANDVAATLRSQLDPRLHAIGTLVPDRNGRGLLTFRVPELPPADYAVAAWCPGCAAWSRGRTFFG